MRVKRIRTPNSRGVSAEGENTQTPQKELAQLKVFYKTVENELTIVIEKLMKINDKYPDDIPLPEAIRELQILRDMCVRYG